MNFLIFQKTKWRRRKRKRKLMIFQINAFWQRFELSGHKDANTPHLTYCTAQWQGYQESFYQSFKVGALSKSQIKILGFFHRRVSRVWATQRGQTHIISHWTPRFQAFLQLLRHIQVRHLSPSLYHINLIVDSKLEYELSGKFCVTYLLVYDMIWVAWAMIVWIVFAFLADFYWFFVLFSALLS